VEWKFTRKEWLHFIPAGIYLLYRIIILAYDAFQPGFADTQNGILMQSLNMGIGGAIFNLFMFLVNVLYLAFSIQLYYQYRIRIEQFYSNTFKIELNWLRNFLLIYSLLFLYGAIQTVLGNNMIDLHYTHKWWLEFLYAASIIYIGIKGFFTPVEKLKDVTFDTMPSMPDSIPDKELGNRTEEIARLTDFMDKERLYLDPDLTLKDLADQMKMAPSDLSLLINKGIGTNFNDFINAYRVEEVKKQIINGEHINKSLVGIASDCGFNSKATFNRVFKKITGKSPSEYISLQ
jgi:AraC-like DNA-binding protein